MIGRLSFNQAFALARKAAEADPLTRLGFTQELADDLRRANRLSSEQIHQAFALARNAVDAGEATAD